ncbi:MAG: ABC transporter ATP-binding protein [Hylemonella sp.]|nr:ABC transporter ATP-binding protein [Hylemonella sp.]
MGKLQVRLQNHAPMPLSAEFECAAGELIALVGPSGSGKTSLLRAVAGLLRAPQLQGTVQVGEQLWFDSARGIHLTPQQRRVGLVFQHYALFPHLSALENVAVACPSSLDIRQDASLRALFQRLGLAGLEQRRPAQLSGGQQQRVALARALRRILRPQDGRVEQGGVLLLDEPFSAVDAPTRQTLYRELAALRQQVSTPMVLVTHDLSEARRLADRVVIVDAGTTLQSGPPERVFSSPRNARVADLVGIQNHFRGHFRRQPGDQGVLRWEGPDGAGMDLQVVDKHRLEDGVAVTWVLAGEHVDVLRADTPQPAGEMHNLLRCELVELLALGETSLCTLVPEGLPSEKLTLNLSTAQLRSLGSGVGGKLLVQIPRPGIHIMPQRTGG